jgi:alcohol dehydrogenase (NADP+)
MDVRGWAALAAKEPLVPWTFRRRDVGDSDVAITISHSGICHSDIHRVREEWVTQDFPIVPGHEIIGHVSHVGSKVSKFTVGQRVGVGVYVDSCRECENCLAGATNYCHKGASETYANFEQDGVTPTYGGYSTGIVVDENYVVSIPDALDSAKAAPLPCAGITVYSPLKQHGAGPGKKVGVIGLGGLGHLAVQFAKALGAEVTVFSRSEAKRDDAIALGADDLVVSSDAEQMAKRALTFDIIINTVSAPLDPADYLKLLRLGGVLVLVGITAEPYPVHAFDIVQQRRQIAGSMFGSIQEMQEMLDFAAEKGVEAQVEVISAEEINDAYERVVSSDVRYRFVIDASTF